MFGRVVSHHERLGKSADEIALEYDLTLADVYAALADYFDHRQEIDGRMTGQQSRVSRTLRATSDMHEESPIS